MLRPLRLGLGVLWLLVGIMASDAVACSCDASPPCAAYWRADAVFVGRVTGTAARNLPGEMPSTSVRMSVVRVFRGELTSEVILQSALTSCSYLFRNDETYLVFARRAADGRLATGMCSGTKPLSEADADITAVERLPSLPPLGRVYGSVQRTLRSTDPGVHAAEPAVGVEIELASARTIMRALTDADGHFEMTRIPPGTYTARAIVPDTIRVYGSGPEVEVLPRACVPLGFELTSNGRVSGRLRRSDGAPATAVRVELRAADGEPADSQLVERRATFSDAQGRFTFEGILPGRYYLGVNTWLGPDLRAPYAPRYYPNAPDRTGAYIIDLGEGELKIGFDFVLTTLTEMEVREIADAAKRPRQPPVVEPAAVPPAPALLFYPPRPIFRHPFLSLPDARRPGG